MLTSRRTADSPDCQVARILSVKRAKTAYNDARTIARTEVLGLLRFIEKIAKSRLKVGCPRESRLLVSSPKYGHSGPFLTIRLME